MIISWTFPRRLSWPSWLATIAVAFVSFSNCALMADEAVIASEKLNTTLPVVEFETTQGTITLQLFPHAAPKACENFITHVKQGYYNNIRFHRIIPGFMIQGGDPTGTGRGGQSIWKRPFDDEFYPGLSFDRPGLLAMANAGPCTNGSQFFITVAPTPWLTGNHTIFGEVICGYDVVLAISKQGMPDGRILSVQKIIKATVIEE